MMSNALCFFSLISCVLQVIQAVQLSPFQTIPNFVDSTLPAYAKVALETIRVEVNTLGTSKQSELQAAVDELEPAESEAQRKVEAAIYDASVNVTGLIGQYSGSKPICTSGREALLMSIERDALSDLEYCFFETKLEAEYNAEIGLNYYVEFIEHYAQEAIDCLSLETDYRRTLTHGKCVAKKLAKVGEYYSHFLTDLEAADYVINEMPNYIAEVTQCGDTVIANVVPNITDLNVELVQCVSDDTLAVDYVSHSS